MRSLTQSGSSLSEYYHKFNSLWRQFDSLVNLPECTCEGNPKLKSHNQLLRLMQFLMGLDEVYAPIRSNILTADPLPDVKTAFATLSRDESHRNSNNTVNAIKPYPAAFVTKTNNWSANNNKSNNQNRRFNRNTSLVCKHCNMTGHTIDRCFELIGYPESYKRKEVNKTNNVSNNVNNMLPSGKEVQGAGTSHTLTSEQYKKLMSLIEESGSKSNQSSVAGFNSKVPGGDW